MTEEEYLQDRLENQITWYDTKSLYNQRRYKRLRLMEIIAAALIPFLSGMSGKLCYSEWIIGGLGVIIAVSAAAGALYKYHENWIQYRTTAEQLKHEKFIYLTRTGLYAHENRFITLVERIESLISKENSNWAQLSKQQGQPTDKNK